MPGELAGRVAVVSVSEPGAAWVLASRGAAVVVVGRDAEAVGRVVADLPGRAAGFVGDVVSDADADALAELVAELFAGPAS